MLVLQCTGASTSNGPGPVDHLKSAPQGRVVQHEPSVEPEAVEVSPATEAESEPISQPVALQAQTFELALQGLPSPLVEVPPGMNAPLVVAAHGAGGSPEWQCDWLRSLVNSRPLLLTCLRGKPMLPYEGAYYYPEHHTLGKIWSETLRALAPTLQQRGSSLHTYVGYSQGATMGALMLHEVDVVPPHLLLVEGGYEGWTDKRCQSFRQRGGLKVYFACGTTTCAKQAKVVVERLKAVGVEAQYAWARGAGHTPGGAVGEFAALGLKWLLNEP
jgi:hypothetical protein